jgi:hypothetical protein
MLKSVKESKSSKSQSESESESEAQAKPQQQNVLTVKAPQRPPATVDEAMDRHLAEWGGAGGRMFTFNGSTGVYHTIDDGADILVGTKFVALLHLTGKGFIKFNAGAPPTVHMVKIYENVPDIEREELGDLDREQWPIGMNGEKEDPWKPQFAIPMQRYDTGGEIFILIARGVVSMNSVGDLLGRFRGHPKRKAGCIPVVRIESGTYPSKKFGGRKPKPVYAIDGWVTPTGEPAPELPKPSLAEELNDEVGF